MNIWNWLTRSRITGGDGANLANRQKYVNAYRNRLRGHYDAARTTDENERHWLNADYLSPNALLKPAVRARVRARARYEAQQNNSYAKGMILTLANDMVGKGPRLQINELSKPAAIKLQKIWSNWAAEIKLAQKLRTMRMAKCVDGEAFALLIVNDKLKSPIKLDIVLIESDRVEEPFEYLRLEDEGTDAIRKDASGNVTHYYVQDHHPGADVTPGAAVGRWVPADSVLHVFRQDRPEQD
ncbi:phage portal protein, partial [bacterium]|nr:phage portal protein [bacterium]